MIKYFRGIYFTFLLNSLVIVFLSLPSFTLNFVNNTHPLKDKNTTVKAAETGTSYVTAYNGKLYVDGQLFVIKGINYNPVSIGSDQIDPDAPVIDVPNMALTGANTIATYNSSKFEWENYSNAGSGDTFYANLAAAAETKSLKIIVGYFSNQAINWTDTVRVAKVTTQYQNLVLQAKNRPSTLIYMIGNETFEKMANDSQRLAYAKWIGQMVDWTHTNDPNHPVTYADNDQMAAMNWLKTYAPNLDIYSYNNYVWSNSSELKSALSNVVSKWPGKPVILHEWGVDSFDVPSWSENRSLQAGRIEFLIPEIEKLYSDSSITLLGQIIFEYSDDWNKLGTSSSQTPDQGWAWGCKTPFDGKCNEEYWGLSTAVNSGAANTRVLKPAFYSLQKVWTSPSPSATTIAGDIIVNGKVDIFDYNQLMTDFGKTGTGLISDIEKSGTSLNRVDIFDYNLLLSNFGK